MMDKLRVAVIGLGWAGRASLQGFLAQDDVEVLAVADSNETLLNRVATRFNIPNAYTDYEHIIVRDDIDAIATATPNFMHEPVVVSAMESGKHAMTEKPLAHTLESAERMVAAAEKYNRVLKMVTNQRNYEDVKTLKRFIDAGNVGRIYHAKAHWMRRQGIPGAGGWFSQKAMSGGGPMIDLGIHVLDFALYFMNEPTPVSVNAASYAEHGRVGRGYRDTVVDYSKHDVEDFVSAFIRFEGGATLTLDVSWTTYSSYGDDFGVALYGTEGGGEIDIRSYDRENSLKLFTDVGNIPTVAQPKLSAHSAGHEQVARDFVDRIHAGDWANDHGQAALQRSRIIDACYRSAAEKREIILNG